MDKKIKEFEKAAIDVVSGLRNELGAKFINMAIRVDEYGKSCKTDITFFTSIPADASHVPGCGPACKGD